MIEKELGEILDALTRETGESMRPFQELEILGFDPLGRTHDGRQKLSYDAFDDEYDDDFLPGEAEEEDGVEYNDYDSDNNGYIDEEYDFDEDDEEYRLLTDVLRLNNDRRKYFA